MLDTDNENENKRLMTGTMKTQKHNLRTRFCQKVLTSTLTY